VKHGLKIAPGEAGAERAGKRTLRTHAVAFTWLRDVAEPHEIFERRPEVGGRSEAVRPMRF
jgi:hypothetical protein